MDFPLFVFCFFLSAAAVRMNQSIKAEAESLTVLKVKLQKQHTLVTVHNR